MLGGGCRKFVRKVRQPSGMASVAVERPDLFPPGVEVSIFPGAYVNTGTEPGGFAVATGIVDSRGRLEVSDPAITRLESYVAFARVGGEPRQARLKATAA